MIYYIPKHLSLQLVYFSSICNIMEQLTYESSTSEDDIQIVKHDSCNNETDSDDHGVAPAKREK